MTRAALVLLAILLLALIAGLMPQQIQSLPFTTNQMTGLESRDPRVTGAAMALLPAPVAPPQAPDIETPPAALLAYLVCILVGSSVGIWRVWRRRGGDIS